MSDHLSEEVIVLLIDNELSPTSLGRARSHLAGCTRCRSRFDELQGANHQFMELFKRSGPTPPQHLDLLTGQLRRKLVLTQTVAKVASKDNEAEPRDEVPEKALAQPMSNVRRFPGQSFSVANRMSEPSLLNRRACSVTFAEGENFFRKGNAAYQQGLMELAITYWQEAKSVFLSLNVTKEIAACDRNVAFAQRKLGQPKLALDQVQKAKALFEKIGHRAGTNSCNQMIRDLRRETTGHTWQ